MAKDYGIGFCKKVLRHLEEAEEKLFEELGHGFDYFSQEYTSELTHKRLLRKFEQEKELGLEPSYNPDIHGSWNN